MLILHSSPLIIHPYRCRCSVNSGALLKHMQILIFMSLTTTFGLSHCLWGFIQLIYQNLFCFTSPKTSRFRRVFFVWPWNRNWFETKRNATLERSTCHKIEKPLQPLLCRFAMFPKVVISKSSRQFYYNQMKIMIYFCPNDFHICSRT